MYNPDDFIIMSSQKDLPDPNPSVGTSSSSKKMDHRQVGWVFYVFETQQCGQPFIINALNLVLVVKQHFIMT